jgi:hypothetical protein
MLDLVIRWGCRDSRRGCGLGSVRVRCERYGYKYVVVIAHGSRTISYVLLLFCYYGFMSSIGFVGVSPGTYFFSSPNKSFSTMFRQIG